MRRGLAFGVGVLAVLAATPAAAERWNIPRPSPCERPIPTGRPLPRQGIVDAVGDVLMLATPTPSWRDRPIGLAGRGERVTILQECGMTLRIRNVRGLEGFIHTVSISDERKAYDAAKNRPPETIADCELLYLDPVVIDRCKIKLEAEQAHRDEVANSPYLSADEMRRFIVGRTMTLVERFPQPYDKNPPIVAYHAADGEYFIMQGRPQDSGLRGRGRYALVDDTLCYPREDSFCGRLRKVGDGLVWATAKGKEFTVTATDGDTAGVVAEVSKWKPHPVEQAPPEGTEDVAGPRL